MSISLDEDYCDINHGRINENSEIMSPTSLKFEDAFESFIQADSPKEILSCFDNMCTKSLKLNCKQIFENGINLADLYAATAKNTNTPTSSRLSGGSYQFRIKQKQHLAYLASQPPTRLIYQVIKEKTEYWKANELWKCYDKRLAIRDYSKNSPQFNKDLHILIIGCGPVGLRLAIECAFLGIKCSIVEKRDNFSRNNVLHLWPYTIVDLKNLGAKLFYGKFCAGSIDHISIRKLQCILLKVALLVGVQVYFNTSFESIIEPKSNTNDLWRVKLFPENSQLSNCSFDCIIGADGRRNTLPGFNRKEFRKRLAIGITANFTNYHTAAEVEVEEKSGVSFIFAQKFFLNLRNMTGIDLENIVYYKDETHYFVMTAKKSCLIQKGVIRKDITDPVMLLDKENVDFEKLCDFAKEAAFVSTNKKLTTLNFAKNHNGQPDVAMFDFTSLFQAENSTRIVERNNKKLLMSLVGDSLLEPFWPLGTGIARGFLAAFDTAWSIKQFANQIDPMQILHQRESIYQLLSQTMPDNLSKNFQEYSIDPTTRYVNLNVNYSTKLSLQANQVQHLYDNETKEIYLTRTETENQNQNVILRKKKFSFNTSNEKDDVCEKLLFWCQTILQPLKIQFENFSTPWKNGLALCAIVNRYRPDLINSQNLSNLINKKYNQCEIDFIKWKPLFDILKNNLSLEFTEKFEKFLDKSSIIILLEKMYNIFKIKKKLIDENSNINKRKINNALQEDTLTRSVQIKRNNLKRNSLMIDKSNEIHECEKKKIISSNRPKSVLLMSHNFQLNNFGSNSSSGDDNCYLCGKRVYLMERETVLGHLLHKNCFRCNYCKRVLRHGLYNYLKDPITFNCVFYCINHIGLTTNPTNSKVSESTSLPINNDQAHSKSILQTFSKQFSQNKTIRKDLVVFENKNGDTKSSWHQNYHTDPICNLNKLNNDASDHKIDKQ